MANYLEAYPDAAELVAHHRVSGGYVPFATRGELLGFVHPCSLHAIVPDNTITAADYVVGMELLGFTFEVVSDSKQGHWLGQYDPAEPCPEAWHKRAIDLMRALPRSGTRDVIAFLIERDGEDQAADMPVLPEVAL